MDYLTEDTFLNWSKHVDVILVLMKLWKFNVN